MPMDTDKRRILAWALYDWGNSAFATTVMAGFFPIFFKQYWSQGTSATESTFYLGLANGLSSLVVVVMAPVLGAIADRAGLRKRFLMVFGFLGILMTASLSWVAEGQWLLASALFGCGVVGFSGSIVFYDALIVGVCRDPDRERVSAFGYGLGYLGGGLLFALNVWMTLEPATFGLADAAEAVKLSFVLVAIWWLLFSLPLVLLVKEPPVAAARSSLGAVRGGLHQLRETLSHIRQRRQVFWFLLAYWLYIDAVDTIIRMAVDYGVALGFDSGSLIVALLITQFVGFPAALAYGWLGSRIGAKAGILIAICVYIAVTFYAFFMESVQEFYVLAVTVGLVQGGVQALSRSFYSRLIPPERSGEFFGFYNMLGKFAAVLGPVLVGWVGVLTGSSRYGILSVVLLLVAGGLLLLKVDGRGGRAEPLPRQEK
ncbi:MFS transporter [Marinobacterium nitratireducens]|uniref:MFS transporter n=1 Tax=Marinobacterium nitratireducens TaxID=518897 RepID=A0A917ZL42_9GAMM|nr:MFS transporter [Marinobacterium nitratireducens]GGO85792.1 MFS transporter [Marinobacterium nitratireducens]